MKTIVVEDDHHKFSMFLQAASQLSYIEIIGFFHEWTTAWNFLRCNPTDLIVLDVQTLGHSIIDIGKQLRKYFPDLKLLYITNTETYHYALEAVRVNAAAYILKPYAAGDLDYAIKASKLLLREKRKRIFARTFGHFDLFVDDKAVVFKSSKSRELLALLIDRCGGIVTSDQAIGTLWEYRANDEATQSLYSKVGKSLQKQLEEVNAGDLVNASRGAKSISMDKLDCDLYQLLAGDKRVKEMYFGQYMVDYSWAEYRVPVLERYLKE